MKFTPRTPRRMVRRFVWTAIESGSTIAYQLGGELALRRFIRAMPIKALLWSAREKVASSR
jgi:hypothetical protein